jgi:hypothetical protein
LWFVLLCFGWFWSVGGTVFEKLVQLEQETALVEAKAASGKVVTAEADDVVAKQAEPAEFGLRIISMASDEIGGGRVTEGDPAGQFFGERGGEEALDFQVARERARALEEFASSLVRLPIAKAAAFPLGDVLLRDRASGEFGGEDGADVGQRIKPLEEVFEFLTVVEAEVELFADLVRKTGDFAGASHGNGAME